MSDLSIRQLFEAALTLSAPERAAFLSGHCRRDARRRARVEALLRAHDHAGGFLALPEVERPDAAAGQQVGPFELVARIGEGGSATVYLARQHTPIERDVALKILKDPVDSAQWLARFDAERRVLSRMDHPGIARVLDAGTTATGRPYCAIELVRGQPITDYCEAAQLDLRRRLEVFLAVCRAVQHAHRKGVIHRDLKPANILITSMDGRPVPKVIDFGIAKALDVVGADGITECRQRVGTPLYMSPEQAEGANDIDTRTDVYSLGVVLHELLTGTTPFSPARLRHATWGEFVRVLREEDPPRPSAWLGAASGSGDHRPRRQLLQALRTDLDWVVLKCLAREPGRRYEAVGDLAADLDRFLAGRPVLAAPPDAAYRLRKFLRRYRGQVAAAALAAASLAGGTVGATMFAWRAAQRQEETVQVGALLVGMLEQLDAQRIGAGLERDLRAQLAAAPTGRTAGERDPLGELCATTAAVRSLHDNLFHPTLQAIESTLAGRPALQAMLIAPLGDSLTRLGLHDAGAASQRRVLELLRLAGVPDDRDDMLDAHHGLGEALASSIEVEAALPHAEAAYRGRLRQLGPDATDTLASCELLGRVLMRLDHLDAAEELFVDTLARRRRLLGDGQRDTIGSLFRLAQIRLFQGRLHDAETLLLQARDRLANPDDTLALAVAGAYGNLRLQQGWLQEAETIVGDALTRSRRVRTDDHRESLFLRRLMLDVRLARGDLGRVMVDATALADLLHRLLGPCHRDTLSTDAILAAAAARSGDLTAAEARWRSLWRRAREGLGPAEPYTLFAAHQLACLLERRGDAPAARGLREQSVRDGFACLEASLARKAPELRRPFFAMAVAIDDNGGLPARMLARLAAPDPTTAPRRCRLLCQLANALLAAGRPADAIAVATAGNEFAAAAPDGCERESLQALATAARGLMATGRPGEALLLYEAIARRHAARAAATGLPAPAPALGHARCLLALGRVAEAERLLLATHRILTFGHADRRPPVVLVDAIATLYEQRTEAMGEAGRQAARHWRDLASQR